MSSVGSKGQRSPYRLPERAIHASDMVRLKWSHLMRDMKMRSKRFAGPIAKDRSRVASR